MSRDEPQAIKWRGFGVHCPKRMPGRWMSGGGGRRRRGVFGEWDQISRQKGRR